MKKQIKHIAIWLLVILAAPAFAQNTNGNLSRLDGKITGVIYHISAMANSNFFLQRDWATGSIVREDNIIFDNVRMRYQALDDELVAYNEQLRSLFIIDKETVKEFRIPSENGEMHFVKLSYDGLGKGQRYFHQIYNGSYKLLGFYHVEEEKTTPFMSQGIMRDTEYHLVVNYYLYNGESGFNRMQMKRRSFFKVFPEKKKEIRKLFRKNHVLILDKQGMIQAFKLLEDAGIMK